MINKNTSRRVVGLRLRRMIAVGLVSGLTMSAPAFAQGTHSKGSTKSSASPEETKRVLALVRTANDAFDSEDYERAYDLYLEASEVYPQPVIMYRLGLSAEKTGRTRQAVEHYEALLAMDAGSDAAKDVRSRLPELRAVLPALVTIESTPSGASVYLNQDVEKFLGKTPVEAEIKSGDATIVVSFPSHKTEERAVKLEAGGELKLQFNLEEVEGEEEALAEEAKAAARSELEGRKVKAEDEIAGMEPRLTEKTTEITPIVVDKASDGSGMQVLSWVLIGTGVAAVAGGGVLSFLQDGKTDDVNSYNKRAPGASPSELQGLKDDANNLYTWSLISYISGGVLVAAGAGLLTYDLLQSNDDVASAQGFEMKLDMGVASGGGWFGVNGRF